VKISPTFCALCHVSADGACVSSGTAKGNALFLAYTRLKLSFRNFIRSVLFENRVSQQPWRTPNG
jgi:hypothetical protein